MGVCWRVCVWMLAVAAATAAPDGPSSTWLRPQPQQTLMEVVTSIEEKLRNFDSSRLESNLKTIEVRLDSLEASFRRLDTAFQDRLDKLERNLNAKELKDELTVEKLSHKVRDILDTSYDRYTRRLGYTDERLDMSVKKVQMNVEAGLNRLEKLQEDIQTEVVEAVTILEELKAHSTASEDRLNSTHRALQSHIQSVITPSQEQLQRISGSLEQLGSRLNSSGTGVGGGGGGGGGGGWASQSQADSLPPTDLLASLRTQINSEANRFTNKVNNMYNDMWRRVGTVEALVREAGRAGNATHRELMDELRQLTRCDRTELAADSRENFLEVALDALERKVHRRLGELGRRLDERLDSVAAAQSLIVDGCFDDAICRGLEHRLSSVLEKIFDVYADKIEGFSNSTMDLDSLVVEMMEMAKAQHSQLIRTVTHNTNMVMRLAQDAGQANKQLLTSVDELANRTSNHLQELGDEIEEISVSKPCKTIEKTDVENVEEETTPRAEIGNKTDITVITIDTTTPSVNPQSKLYDSDILMITTEDEVMADNSTMPRPIAPKKPNVLQIIGMISPNLTRDQVDSFLYYLNSTVDFDNLEAIIQNTEADSLDEEEEYVDEAFDVDNINTTASRNELDSQFIDEISLKPTSSNETQEYLQTTTNVTQYNIGNSTTGTNLLPGAEERSSEAELIDEEREEETVPDLSSSTKSDTFAVVKNDTEVRVRTVPEVLKEEVKVIALLMKIKNSNISVEDLWTARNDSENTMKALPNPTVQKLCYGEKNVSESMIENLVNVMEKRLIVIRLAINDDILYEKVETMCGKLTELFKNKFATTTPATE